MFQMALIQSGQVITTPGHSDHYICDPQSQSPLIKTSDGKHSPLHVTRMHLISCPYLKVTGEIFPMSA